MAGVAPVAPALVKFPQIGPGYWQHSVRTLSWKKRCAARSQILFLGIWPMRYHETSWNIMKYQWNIIEHHWNIMKYQWNIIEISMKLITDHFTTLPSWNIMSMSNYHLTIQSSGCQGSLGHAWGAAEVENERCLLSLLLGTWAAGRWSWGPWGHWQMLRDGMGQLWWWYITIIHTRWGTRLVWLSWRT